MGQILGLLIFLVLVGFFVIISVLNKKTPVPESCQHAYMEAQSCETCAVSGGCSFKEAIDMMKEIKK
ncbi:hypothetical protein [Paracholeplasma manati]|jgi:hypothetical protein|uniref:Membrane or secreted protein n=1 Tax=Paracholeplasma manati TaxID=591373 RepID=A0ABT2Y4C6_9MOLU|nr:hypothetical protein [Paracholeplasma manati]MCV2231580.1 hypothetical protein [Paracholeplasma manati]MDG0889374.1 hypothetical protein [Paracholeplasma manati]MDX9807849.1 hypothetical protein [Acholeplasma sp.]